MFDEVPAQVWLLIAFATAGYAPARYVWQHVVHSPAYRDIIQPPEDLEWRTPRKLALSLVIILSLVALAVFIFTPAAARFARSAIFVPALLGALGTFALGSVANGFFTGRITPLARGFSNTYERETQPRRFWASLTWTAVLGCAMLALAPEVHQDQRDDQCSNYGDRHSPREQLEACNALLADGTSADRLADLLGRRGIAYHDLGEFNRALRDYSRAIDLDPEDSYSLYNRAVIREHLGDLPGAVEEYNASLRLRPDNEDAYFNRGLIFLNVGAFDMAVSDFTRAYELDPEDRTSLANRGIAYAWKNDRVRAEADLAAVEAADPLHPVVLRGPAILALQQGNRQEAAALLTAALQRDPTDSWALGMRASTYWQLGLHDKARDDDDRLADADTVLQAMAADPILIERPLVETENGVRLCRPADRLEEIL